MKIKLGKYIVTVFEVVKLEKAELTFDTEAAKRQVEEIKQSAQFAELKKQADRARALREIKDTEFGKILISQLAR